MRLSRYAFTRYFTCWALLCAFLSITPRIALAEDWETVANAQYWCLTNVAANSFNEAPNISLSVNNTDRSGINTLKPTTSTVGSVTGITNTTVMYVIVPITGGNITANKKFRINTDDFTMRFYYHTSSGSAISYYTAIPQSVRYWVFSGGWQRVSQVNGVFSYPGLVQYVAISFVSPGATVLNSKYDIGLYQWASTFCNLKVQVADGEPTIETAIQNQTDTIMNTDGSDDIVDSTSVGNQVQQIEGLDLFQQIGNVGEQVGNAITTQDVDTNVTFPGMNLAGFTIPSATIEPMSFLDENTQGIVKLMVTFVFCSAFISHIISLLQAIFGIYEYGVGVEDFGNGSMSFGPSVKSWKADYSVDEDLGF